MPPKKAETEDSDANAIKGFTARETKLLAAAFVASVGPDKYDYDLMATLTGNTAGTLKKMIPQVKRKAMDDYPSFSKLLVGHSNDDTKAAISKAGGPKRKATSKPEGEDADNARENEAGKKGKAKKAPAKGRGRAKKAKVEADDAAAEYIKEEKHSEGDDN